MLNMKKFLAILLAAFCCFSCDKDGSLSPQNGIFQIEKDGAFVEANKFKIQLPAEGGSFTYKLLYTGGQNGYATLSGEESFTKDGITVRLLDDIKFEMVYDRWGTGVLKQTMEITAPAKEGKGSKKISVLLRKYPSGVAELTVLQ